MKDMSESTGMSVLRPIAIDRLKNSPEKKKRIWSDELECWGFFSNEDTKNEDIFLLFCNISIGDRMIADISDDKKEIYIVIGIWKEKINGTPAWFFRLMNQAGAHTDLTISENTLFKEAW